MTVAAQSVMLGFGVIAALFAYIGFRMNESDEYLQQLFGYFFFSLCLVFINIIAFLALSIAENNSLNYLIDGGILPAVTVVMWALVLFTVAMLIRVFWALMGFFVDWWSTRRRRGWRNKDSG